MPYKFKTNFYRIPVMGEGDMLTEEQEWVQMSTIDNLLHAATFGCTKAFLEEGAYALEWDGDHTACWLKIRPLSEGNYALLGIINCRMFMSMDEVSVGTLYPDGIYYVYVEYDNGLETDANCFSVRAYTSKQTESDRRMALCVVDTHGEGSVDTDTNKVYAKNILAHTMDSTNPHGRTQTQEVMKVTDSLEVKGNPVHGVVFKKAYSAGNGNAVEVIFDSEPLYLTVYPESLAAGEIAWMIDGNIALVFNAGDEGVVLNIRADMK